VGPLSSPCLIACKRVSPGDSWLDITTQDMERMFQERSGGAQGLGLPKATQEGDQGKGKRQEPEGEEAGYSLVAVTQGMKSFLSTMSSHEGAELPW